MEFATKVTVLRKSLVAPSTPTNKSPVFLSCLDIFWKFLHYTRRVIFYKTSPQDVAQTIERLKTSLSVVLVHFYEWAGRLSLGEDQRLAINCNDLGAEFVEATIELPISQLEKDDFQVKDYFESLCQHVEHSGENLYTSPLLSVQATRFSDGGLAIALSSSHVVADGQSLWHFLVSWGECARGVELSLEPFHEREKLAVQNPSPEKAFFKIVEDEDEHEGSFTEKNPNLDTIEESEKTEVETLTTEGTDSAIFEETAIKNESASGTGKSTEHDGKNDRKVEGNGLGTVQALFHMSGASISKLKSEAAATTGNKFSSFVVLCAHFWQRVSIARQLPFSETVIFATPASYRNRITPPLPAGYFGNVIAFIAAKSSAGTIAEASLGSIAARFQEAIYGAKEERLLGFMNWLEVNKHDMSKQERPKGSFMNAASSPHFPAYKVDFGWGKPAAARALRVYDDGELVLFGGRPGSDAGDVEICTALSPKVLENLRRDPHLLATFP